VRPTHDGIAEFQSTASVALHRLLSGDGSSPATLASLNDAYRESLFSSSHD
jgi:hypothetical protein